jgi:hypothetical protein
LFRWRSKIFKTGFQKSFIIILLELTKFHYLKFLTFLLIFLLGFVWPSFGTSNSNGAPFPQAPDRTVSRSHSQRESRNSSERKTDSEKSETSSDMRSNFDLNSNKSSNRSSGKKS